MGFVGEAAGRSSFLDGEIGQVDGELVRLARGGSALRLRLGERLAELVRTRGFEDLGFSTIDYYVRERCGLSSRWAADSRSLARKLGELPLLREALVSGTLGWCMAEVVARKATPESERFLVALARHSTVRRMRELLKDADEKEEPKETPNEPEPARETVRLRRTVDADALALFDKTRELVRLHVGTRAADAVWEALLAEGYNEFVEFIDEETAPKVRRPPVAPEVSDPPPFHFPGVVEERAWAAGSERANASETSERGAPSGQGWAKQIDREVVGLSREIARRHLRMGELALELQELGGHRVLGYASESQYSRERLGLSHSSIKSKLWLARHVVRFPELGEALEQGRVGLEAARLVTRVATQESVEAWVVHAEHRTFKHLREDVERVEIESRIRNEVPVGPPGQMSGGASTRPEMADDPTAVRPRVMGRRVMTFGMSAWVAELFLAVEQGWKRAGRPHGDFIRFLCVCFVDAWEHELDPDVAYAEVYWRDGWRCTSPTCERQDVTPHHLVFRSQGGGDESDNVITLCSWCHLEGIHHVGSIQAVGPASEVTWKTPVLEVRGREVTWRRGAHRARDFYTAGGA